LKLKKLNRANFNKFQSIATHRLRKYRYQKAQWQSIKH